MVPRSANIIEWARKHIGVKEKPKGSNDGAGLRFMLRDTNFEAGQAWCMFFAEAAIKAGFEGFAEIPEWITHTGSCQMQARKAEKAGQLSKFAATGCIVLFANRQGTFHHAGIVTEINEAAHQVKSIQGNTSGRKGWDGGEVWEHWNSTAGCMFVIW